MFQKFDLYRVVCTFVLFLLAIALSFLLRYTDSDYTFGIFKLFLSMSMAIQKIVQIKQNIRDSMEIYKVKGKCLDPWTFELRSTLPLMPTESFPVSIPYQYQYIGARVAQWVRSLDLTTHTSLSPIRRGFALGFVNYKKGCTQLAATSDKVYQLLAHGRWFSPGTPASSTTKTGRHDIAEILLKVALKHQQSIKSINQSNT